ncbi:MAG: HAD family hydrolase [Candidatus Nanopelagicales bacterium]
MTAVGAVLFDLDDTLLDAAAAWRSGVGSLLRHAPAVPLEDGLAAWAEVFPGWFDRYLTGTVSLADSRAGRVTDWCALLDLDLPSGAALAWFDTFIEGYRAGWTMFDDVPGVLAELAGLPMGIVTNGDGAQQREKVAALGLDAHVSVVVVSSDMGAAKPAPAMFGAAARALGVRPGECVVVGDQWDTDIEGALASGMRPVWLQRPGGAWLASVLPAAPADGGAGAVSTIESLAELPEMLVPGLPGPGLPGPGLPGPGR